LSATKKVSKHFIKGEKERAGRTTRRGNKKSSIGGDVRGRKRGAIFRQHTERKKTGTRRREVCWKGSTGGEGGKGGTRVIRRQKKKPRKGGKGGMKKKKDIISEKSGKKSDLRETMIGAPRLKREFYRYGSKS